MTYEFYDINNNIISYKKITLEIKKQILNNELKPININNDFKINMSNDDSYIAMFDIVSKNIELVFKSNIYKLLRVNNFRVLNNELITFFKNNNYSKDLINKVLYFDFNVLESLFLRFVYYNSKEVGADISYYLNPAYIPFYNIKPYLKKSSIINTALNTSILKIEELPINDKKLNILYDNIVQYLFTKEELEIHIKKIKSNNLNNILNFYSVYGAYYINEYLRGNIKYQDENVEKQIIKISKTVSEIPKLKSDKLLFRFIKDDSFMGLKKVGDIYVNNSFMSCTRKPNINAQKNEFGFILLKINLTSKYSGYYLSIESESGFDKEKEVIIKPGVKFKLKSINNDVEFYLFEKKYMRNIKKKYELEIIGIEDFNIPKLPKAEILELNYDDVRLDGDTLDEKINYFWNTYCKINKCCYIILPNGIKKLFYFNYYDSIDIYERFHYYKTLDGFFCFSYDDEGNIDIFIEFGESLIVNYPSRHINFAYNKNQMLIMSIFCYIFEIQNIILYPNYKYISEISDTSILLSRYIKINDLLYKILYNKTVLYNINKYSEIINYLNEKVNKINIPYNLHKFYEDNITYKDLLLKIINYDIIYLRYVNELLPNIVKYCHYIINPYEYLLDNNIINFIPSSYSYNLNKKYVNVNIYETEKINFFEESILY